METSVNNRCRAFTSLEQSRKLAEILPIESADMWWSKNFIYYNPTATIGISAEYSNVYTYKFGEDDIPCWSLAALLNILPETIEDESATYDLEIDMIDKKPKYVWLGDCYHSDFPSWDWDNKELLDNIVEAVIWLNNNGYLRHEKLH